eukprot:SAG11_NODE_13434_length_655_cov_1.116906_2_plen_78_part_01
MDDALRLGVSIRILGASMMFLLVLKVVKACDGHPGLYFITKTLQVAAPALAPFFFVFGMVFFCFAAAGVMMFGSDVEG